MLCTRLREVEEGVLRDGTWKDSLGIRRFFLGRMPIGDRKDGESGGVARGTE